MRFFCEVSEAILKIFSITSIRGKQAPGAVSPVEFPTLLKGDFIYVYILLFTKDTILYLN